MAEDYFDWQDPSVVIRTQLAVAVYTNTHGDVVVRQEGPYPDDDVWIVFSPPHAAAIARRILEEAGIDPATAFRDAGHDTSAAGSVPKDRTAAERQRRKRDKQRDLTPAVTPSDRDSTVTGRDNRVLKAVVNG